MSDVTPLNRPARFYCRGVHGETNQVLSLDGNTYCLPCLAELAHAHLPPVARLPLAGVPA